MDCLVYTCWGTYTFTYTLDQAHINTQTNNRIYTCMYTYTCVAQPMHQQNVLHIIGSQYTKEFRHVRTQIAIYRRPSGQRHAVLSLCDRVLKSFCDVNMCKESMCKKVKPWHWKHFQDRPATPHKVFRLWKCPGCKKRTLTKFWKCMSPDCERYYDRNFALLISKFVARVLLEAPQV